MNVNFYNVPPPSPLFFINCIDCTFSAARVLKDRSKQLCVKSSDNKLGLPSCRGSSLVQRAKPSASSLVIIASWFCDCLLNLLAFFLFSYNSSGSGASTRLRRWKLDIFLKMSGNRLVNCEGGGVVSTQALRVELEKDNWGSGKTRASIFFVCYDGGLTAIFRAVS